MDSVTLFNEFIIVVLWAALAILALAMVIAALLIGIRIRTNARTRQLYVTVERWREIFLERSEVSAGEIGRTEAFAAVQLWNDFVRTDRVGRAEDLRRIAETAGLDGACGLLLHGHRGERVVGLTFAGSMGGTAHVDRIRELRDDRIGQVSLTAHRAALLCGVEEVATFLSAVEEHTNWRTRNVEEILVEIGYVPPNQNPRAAADDRRAVPRRRVGALRT